MNRTRLLCGLWALAAVFVAGPVLADADDDKWVAKCVMDNADQKQSTETVLTYCVCMVNEMSSSETLSVTAWEKTHPKEEAMCSRKAGWTR